MKVEDFVREYNPETWKETIKKYLPKNSKVFFPPFPVFEIFTDTGEFVITLEDLENEERPKKRLLTQTRQFRFNDEIEYLLTGKSIYVYKVEIDEEFSYLRTRSVEIPFEEDTKKTVTFTVSKEVYEKFQELSDKLAINKSKFIENKIKEFVEKNG